MRILFCSPAARVGGGVELWMESLTQELESREVEVVTALARGKFHDPVRYAAYHRVSNPIPVDGESGFREVRIANLLRVFRRVDPDVILPANLSDAILAAAYAKTRGARSRLAVCLHGQSEEQLSFVNRLAPFIDLATSVSKRMAMATREAMADKGRVRHLPTGVRPPLNGFAARPALRDIAYVGRLDNREKRVLDAVPLIRNLRGGGVTFHFAGAGVDESKLRDRLRGEAVVFHGSLTHEELYRDLYPNVDGLVIFSEAEGGPIVAWEAMAHGVVPIVSDYVGRTEEDVIRNGETGVVFPVGDMAAAADAIRRFTTPGTLLRLSRRTREELPAAYTHRHFVESWHQALSDCIAMPARCGAAAALPPLVSAGRLARLGLSVTAMARLRSLVGTMYSHADSGSEWPH
jgi:glycosyltransferase involved in cell wall biosynthesis